LLCSLCCCLSRLSRPSALFLSSRSLFFFQAEDGIRDRNVTGVQTCALPISTLCAHEGCANSNLLGSHQTNAGNICPCPQKAPRRSEERRVGKECRSRWPPKEEKKKEIESNSAIATGNKVDRERWSREEAKQG